MSMHKFETSVTDWITSRTCKFWSTAFSLGVTLYSTLDFTKRPASIGLMQEVW